LAVNFALTPTLSLGGEGVFKIKAASCGFFVMV